MTPGQEPARAERVEARRFGPRVCCLNALNAPHSLPVFIRRHFLANDVQEVVSAHLAEELEVFLQTGDRIPECGKRFPVPTSSWQIGSECFRRAIARQAAVRPRCLSALPIPKNKESWQVERSEKAGPMIQHFESLIHYQPLRLRQP